MKKRVLAVLLTLALVMSVAVFSVSAATIKSGSCGSRLSYTVTDDGVLTISGTGDMTDYVSSYGGNGKAPWRNSTVDTVIIGEGVTSIGTYAFYNMDGITSVSFPETLTTIDASAFWGCNGLTELVLPESVTTLGDNAFEFCDGLTSLTLSSNITQMGKNVFADCTALTSVEIPEGITAIGNRAFYSCDALASVEIPSTVNSIGEYAFAYTDLTSVRIPEGVTSIPENAFRYCSELLMIEIPASVTSIGEDAFYNCDDLDLVYYYGTEAQWAALATSYPLKGARVITVAEGECSHMYAYDLHGTPETCTEDGLAAGSYCPMCETTILAQEVIPATGHSWDEWVIIKQPTLSAEGSRIHTCTVCGEEETETMRPLSNPFKDVQQGAFYYDAVLWAFNNGITNGYGADDIFAPDATCTRAQVVTFLWRAEGSPEPTTATCPFTDVEVGSWYYKAVLWAAENGITTGTTATTFSPNDTIIREQFVTFLWRVAGEPEVEGRKPFSDIESGTYYYDPVRWATLNGYCTGVGGDQFSPTGSCTRGQTVTFMHRYYADCPVTAPAAIGLSSRFMWMADFRENGYQLFGTVYPAAAQGQTITWTSLNPDVATVSADGVVTPVGEGEATIMAQCGNAVAYCTLRSPDFDMGWYVYCTAQDLDDMILDYHSAPYACTYVDRNGDLCAVVTIFIKYLTVGGFWNEDFYTVSYNTITGKDIEDPASYYDKLADQYWGQNKIHYMEMSTDYMELELNYQNMTEYYQKGLEYGMEGYWVPVGE